MHWITQEGLRVGRIGCAWLIGRFIDPQAEFAYAPAAEVQAEAERLGATIYHVAGHGLERRGLVSSFEVLLERYDLSGDPALALLGQIVNTADIRQSPYARPEGAGLKAITEGLRLVQPDDEALRVASAEVFDALYAYCGEQIRLGRG